MIAIEKIEIKNFRSFDNHKDINNEIIKANHLNILSGANDSGKSNILRALNLFFNGSTDIETFFDFNRDFFKSDPNDDNQAQKEIVSVKISFLHEKNKGKNYQFYDKIYLPERFSITKKWKKTSSYSDFDRTSNVETIFRNEKKEKYVLFSDASGKLKSTARANLQKQLTEFLDSIQYHYVPAIKDRNFFSYLFGELQKTLWKTQKTNIENKKSDFETAIQNETNDLMHEFKLSVANDSDGELPIFELPKNLVNIFKALQVTTGDIDLFLRGDGIQAKLIPEILHFIVKKENEIKKGTLKKGELKKQYFIWGFEEPENSYEYRNAQLLADKFKNIFAFPAQIFLTTHSFNFLSLDGSNVSTYRVWRNDEHKSSRIISVKKDEDGNPIIPQLDSNYETLVKELGIFSLNKDLEKLFLEKEKEKQQLIELQQSVQEKIAQIEKPILFVEDEYDQIYKIAWLKICGHDCNENNFEENFLNEAPFIIHKAEGAGNLEGFLRSKNIDYWNDKKIIGLFDFDEAGRHSFNMVKNNWRTDLQGTINTGIYRLRKNHECFAILLLPVPNRLLSLASLEFPSYVEIENLLKDDFLTSNNFAVQKMITGNIPILEVHSHKKSELWKKLFTLSRDEFEDFTQLFRRVYELFGLPF